MSVVRALPTVALMCVCGLLTTSRVLGDYDSLVRRIPEGANCIVLVDVDGLLNSPLGKKENWRDKHESEFEAGLVIAPPQTERIVVAAHLDLVQLHPQWQTSLMDLKYKPNLAKLATRVKGSLDSIGGLNVAVIPGGTFVVQFSENTFGIGTPANRQTVGRWINETKSSKGGNLSGYLDEAVKFAERGAPIIMALDLEHVFSQSYISDRLSNSETIKQLKINVDTLAKQLASIRGVSLGITVGEKRFGKIKVDFGEELTMTPELAKAMIMHALTNHGVMIHEFHDWNAKVSGKQITLEGHLDESGMRRILSVFDTPPSLKAGSEPEKSPEKTADETADYQKQLVAQTSKKYYSSVVAVINDLKNKNPGGGNSTTGAIAKWYGRYAAKIDQLPVLNVDPDVVAYATNVSGMLRQAETSMRDIGPNARRASDAVQPVYNNYSWGNPIAFTWAGVYGSYGWASVEDSRATRDNQITAANQERIRGYASANLIMQHVDEATGDIRKAMTQKYGMEF
ncbi:MAG: hypothetical protein RIS70_2848 [Planctomycetota bacterium]